LLIALPKNRNKQTKIGNLFKHLDTLLSQHPKPTQTDQTNLPEKNVCIKGNTRMTLDNKLNITDAVELARVEEKLSKIKAHKLFTVSAKVSTYYQNSQHSE